MHAPHPTVSAPARTRFLFVVAILTGSFLLFLVQPMIARMALPRLGGAPAVWNSAMLVYQALLLGGYAYAHWLGRVRVRTQAIIHLAVLALAALWLPIGIAAMRLPESAEPALWVPWLLGASIGPLFFAVSAQAPLLQRWYASASGGDDPYALYAASNVGSFGGLIAYPLLVEPLLALREQSAAWSIGYGALFVLVLGSAALLPRRGDAAAHVPVTSPAPGWPRILHWVVLALVPSGLMLATSSFLTTDIVAVPLLWVLPLALYLLSFTVAFAANRAVADFITRFAPVTILLFGGVMIAGHNDYPFMNAVMSLALLFAVSVALHTCMYRLRPAADRLTGFYLAMSVGGALGGVFAGLLAPVLFDWSYEYPLLILAAGMLAPQAFLAPAFARIWHAADERRHVVRIAAIALVAAVAALGLVNPGNVLGAAHEGIAFLVLAVIGVFAIGVRPVFVAALGAALFMFGGYRALQLSLEPGARTRSYFGVYTVATRGDVRELSHGTTLHGLQMIGDAERERRPTTYYVPGSGVGQAMQAASALYGDAARVGVVGLGAGTLACYAQPGQRWKFFEVDPAVVRLARDSGAFTFLQRCAPDAAIRLGDARLTLAAEPRGELDLLVLDAFSSDAVPLHLMTREAYATYARALASDGLLLVHISNRYLSLEPVVAATARQGGWYAARLSYTPDIADPDGTASDWIALTRDPEVLGALVASGAAWQPLRPYPGVAAWTDDFASILPVMRALHDDLP